jgi:hypothetical protein
MTPSAAARKQVGMRRTLVSQQNAHCLGQVVEINLFRREVAENFQAN